MDKAILLAVAASLCTATASLCQRKGAPVLRCSDPDMPGVVCTGHLTSALYLDNREDAGHYTQVTNYLGTEALTPAGTGRLLAEIIREM